MDNLMKTALAEGKYVAFTDGSCKGNPGPGGAAVWLYVPNGEPIEKPRQSLSTTNNIADMTAVIDALEMVPEGESVLIVLESDYIRCGFEQYLEGWLQRGWRKSNGKEVANCELWKRVHSLAAERHVTFYKISANSNDPDKIRVEALAKEAAEKAAKRAYHAPKGRV
ncbi:Ribonuclease HI [Phaeobacter sp. CECT 5382]|uniref:ribonuclease H family protein n=1 Tax=Phaeobacter sp. CECT 5382 TaxID=1712645 RepID=UPI0006DA6FEF|nr:ribonuclease H [Phaeobacter sp. CECT 5382]CUH89950.1 Ribonuclease HI [Phaeobacter sp. CECT 5382]